MKNDMSGMTMYGKPCKPPFQAFQPLDSIKLFGLRTCSPYNGKEYGVPQEHCYACHCVMIGAAIACTAHGFRRIT
jgi:hypothetical protein